MSYKEQYQDNKLAKSIRKSLNAFALVKTNKTTRNYRFGQWLMADAFMAWLNAIEKPN